MKIAHVIVGLGVGGAESMLLKLLSSFRGTDVTSEVISLTGQGELSGAIEDLGVPVHNLKMNSVWGTPAAVLQLHRLGRKLRVDSVQGWMYHGNLAAAVLAGGGPSRPKLYWNIRHSLADLALEKPMTQQVIRLGAFWSKRPQKVVHNSTVSIAQHSDVGYCSDNAVMIPNGFDLDRFRPDAQLRATWRRRMGVPGEAVVVGTLGRRHPMKGHEQFIAAAGRALAKRDDVHVVMAGRGIVPEDPMLARAVEAAGLADRIHLVGQTDSPQGFLAALDLFCLPSLFGEGFPNVVGEAMACGLPCIATDVGETGTIVDGIGTVIKPGDFEGLVGAIESHLAEPVDVWRQAGADGRKRIAADYSLPVISDRYREMYCDSH